MTLVLVVVLLLLLLFVLFVAAAVEEVSVVSPEADSERNGAKAAFEDCFNPSNALRFCS